MLPHAPGVQMANIPEDGVKVDDGAAMDDADPDKRLPKEVKKGDNLLIALFLYFLHLQQYTKYYIFFISY